MRLDGFRFRLFARFQRRATSSRFLDRGQGSRCRSGWRGTGGNRGGWRCRDRDWRWIGWAGWDRSRRRSGNYVRGRRLGLRKCHAGRWRRWRGRQSAIRRGGGRWRGGFQHFRDKQNRQRRNHSDADEALGQAWVQNQASRDGGKGGWNRQGWLASTGATV